MKTKSLIITFVLLSTLACKSNSENDKNNEEAIVEDVVKQNGLKGTWELTGFYNYKDNVVVDSFDMNPDFRQIKIYTDDKVMWCKHKPADSSDWFGYGTYKYDGERLTEILDFGSVVMDEVIAEKKEFTFELSLTENRFEQIEIDEDGNRIYSENYKRVE
ncbi:hypothetical protein J4050_07745 [Winogradskyella sp. DF17]|uniref:Lipocalin-like domain-containing protein n=1 Tax=Winogradskyella pelagia TaxID=2819984 RepID=A0ABS3T2Y9_9FLAO|nr:hypothetical protein [Winogradskyella sp. DF17]MBO3116634.1 hypothetical protein [Winogradskyella sp. DF17]